MRLSPPAGTGLLRIVPLALGLACACGCANFETMRTPPPAQHNEGAAEDRDTVAAVFMAGMFQSMQHLAQAGQVAVVNGVKIVGFTNVAGRLAASASALYAKNLLTFLEILVDKKEKKLAVNWDDEIVKATALTRDGAVVHPNFMPKTAA